MYLLGAKARARLHELLDEGNTRVIETVALMDRSFQQRRLLEEPANRTFGFAALITQIHQEGIFTQKPTSLQAKFPETNSIPVEIETVTSGES